jgi:hypothetical protein
MVVAPQKWNALRRQAQNLRRAVVFASYEERNLIQRTIEVENMRKGKCKGEENNGLPRDPLGGSSSLFTSPEQS